MWQQQKTVNFIALIVILTIAIQAYWNCIQYANNRKLIINDIQSVLDNVSRDYIKEHTQKSTSTNGFITSEIGSAKTDSIQKIVNSVLEELKSFNRLSSKYAREPSVSYSLIQDSVNLAEFDKLLKKQLKSRNYDLIYNLKFIQNGAVTDSIGRKLDAFEIIDAKSQMAPVESVSTINLSYANPVMPILLKGLAGILSSFLLCGVVLFSLYYLLHIIRKQKQLSEIKHDFISNVTHEFKTPIATIVSAIEAIKSFNNEHISEKTRRHLDISEQQLRKLNLLVEKVMETSLLESSELNLDKQKTDLVKQIFDCKERHQLNTLKNIHFESNIETLEIDIDAFHFENAISNIIDNAIKYGGNEIKVIITKVDKERVIISISDNGEGISKQDEPFIFDKFFRVKSKNLDYVKGFGIGLYYAKNIIEKHEGTIELSNRTTFLVKLWTK